MRKYLLCIGLGMVLALGAKVLDVQAADKDLVSDVNKLADSIQKKSPEAVMKDAEALAKKHDLDQVMHVFSKRNPNGKGGVGVGPKAGVIEPDGIEAKIKSMTKKAPPAADITKDGKDLIRMAEMVAAVTAISSHQCTVKSKMGDKDPKAWKEDSDKTYKGSMDLIKALQAKDGKAIVTACKAIDNACTSCHSKFRE